jgi:hypothetical protein
MTTYNNIVSISPNEVDPEEMAAALRRVHGPIILAADTYRPLADYIISLMKAAYNKGYETGVDDAT